MDRRSVLKTVSILVGGALSAGTVATIMSGCQSPASEGNGEWSPQTLSKEEVELMAEVADTILPATDTPGAKELLVHQAIDSGLTDNFTKEGQKEFKDGLAKIDAACKKANNKSFIEASPEERLAVLSVFDKAAYGENKTESAAFFRSIKSMTIGCFFVTEVAQTQVLQHIATPTKFIGCVPLVEAGNGKTWAQ